MKAKGKVQAKKQGAREKEEPPARERLVKAIEGMSEVEAVRFFDQLAERGAKDPRLQESQEPLFSEEFLQLLSDYGYGTLRSYLEKDAKPEAVELLDSLLMLHYFLPQPKKVNMLKNEIVAETVGAMSKEIVALGGVFTGPMGAIVSGG